MIIKNFHSMGAFLVAVALTPLAFSQPSPEAIARMEAARKAAIEEAAAKPTPKLANGKPDLSGFWTVPSSGGNPYFANRGPEVSEDGSTVRLAFPVPIGGTIEADIRNVANRWEAEKDKRPVYLPAYQAQARDNFDRADLLDPSYRCANPGVPRLGAPSEIVQTPNAVYLLYAGQVNHFRIVPTDGREHDPTKDAMFNGDAIGYWEGDTLVVDVRNIDPTSWLDRDGSFHSGGLHVIERFTRTGNSLRYEMRAEDPIFAQPFIAQPVTLVLGEPGRHIEEAYPCIELSLDNMVGTERH